MVFRSPICSPWCSRDPRLINFFFTLTDGTYLLDPHSTFTSLYGVIAALPYPFLCPPLATLVCLFPEIEWSVWASVAETFTTCPPICALSPLWNRNPAIRALATHYWSNIVQRMRDGLSDR